MQETSEAWSSLQSVFSFGGIHDVTKASNPDAYGRKTSLQADDVSTYDADVPAMRPATVHVAPISVQQSRPPADGVGVHVLLPSAPVQDTDDISPQNSSHPAVSTAALPGQSPPAIPAVLQSLLQYTSPESSPVPSLPLVADNIPDASMAAEDRAVEPSPGSPALLAAGNSPGADTATVLETSSAAETMLGTTTPFPTPLSGASGKGRGAPVTAVLEAGFAADTSPRPAGHGPGAAEKGSGTAGLLPTHTSPVTAGTDTQAATDPALLGEISAASPVLETAEPATPALNMAAEQAWND